MCISDDSNPCLETLEKNLIRVTRSGVEERCNVIMRHESERTSIILKLWGKKNALLESKKGELISKCTKLR